MKQQNQSFVSDVFYSIFIYRHVMISVCFQTDFVYNININVEEKMRLTNHIETLTKYVEFSHNEIVSNLNSRGKD